MGQKSDTLLVFEFPPLLDALILFAIFVATNLKIETTVPYTRCYKIHKSFLVTSLLNR